MHAGRGWKITEGEYDKEDTLLSAVTGQIYNYIKLTSIKLHLSN